MDPVQKILKQVTSTARKYAMFSPGDMVLVAVSGGADSVSLLDILYEVRTEMDIRLGIAHFNHGLRPGEDEKEAEFVRGLSESYGVRLYEGNASKSLREATSLEETARKERYRFLEQAAREAEADKIALGHTMNDQAETVMIRLLRGSGPPGLSGIPPKRGDRIVRPLIEITRGEILAYLHEKGLNWMEDPSNRDPRFLRNRIRHQLLPLLQQYQPDLIPLLSRTAEIFRQDEEWMSEEARGWMEKNVRESSLGGLEVRIHDLHGLAPALQTRVVRAMVKETAGGLRRISAKHISAIRALLDSSRPQAMVTLPGGVLVLKQYQSLRITRSWDQEVPGFLLEIQGPGSFKLEALESMVVVEEVEPTDVSLEKAPSWQAFFDAEKVKYPILIRTFRPGDRFEPLGLGGTKKLKDFFIDQKVPASLRRLIPIFETQEKIMWVGGLRIDERFKVSGHTKKVLKFTLSGRVEQWELGQGKPHPLPSPMHSG